MQPWQIITSEYPPQPGGVSDYTQQVAVELAGAGDEVHVWCPATAGMAPEVMGVQVHRELGCISWADLNRMGRLLDCYPAPRRLLVQWVPHGYGYQSMNLPFCWWLWRRARDSGDSVELMVHEPYFGFTWSSWKQSAVAAVHRLMTILLLQAASRVWVSIPAWEARLRPYTLGRKLPMTWLPVPSNIVVVDDPVGAREVRARYAADGQLLLGHFGTYGRVITDLLGAVLPELMQRHPHLVVLLLGRGSEAWRAEVAGRYPRLAPRLFATGGLDAADLSRHVSACDLMFQPYPDGLSSRRTSAMSGLVHGKPVVTTEGFLSESLWRESGAVAAAPASDLGLLQQLCEGLVTDGEARRHLGKRARTVYEKHFAVNRIAAALRQ